MKTLFIYLLLFVFLFSCNEKEKPAAVVMKTLNYPSASAVEYVNGKLYIMGDDATQMLVLDTNFNVVDSIKLFDYPEKRIPKNIKHDIESMLYLKDSNQLMLFGSGSLSPYRDSIWSIDLNTKEKRSKSFTTFYSSLKNSGLSELNIEGAVKVKNEIVLVNRGNLGWPKNHLIFTTQRFWTELDTISVGPVDISFDSNTFRGISGLAYSNLNETLLMSVSTEATSSSFEDGIIGKSYIRLIKDFSNPVRVFELTPRKLIDLEEIDSLFNGQKIESVTIMNESKESHRLVLVADNDNGSSTIFKLSIKLN